MKRVNRSQRSAENHRQTPSELCWEGSTAVAGSPAPGLPGLEKGKEETMNHVPSGTEITRPFIPAKDFDLSKRFYETLGFEKLLDEDVAIFRVGSGGFILQRHYQKDWAENFMMQLMVDDLDAWWTHISQLDLPGKFNVPPPSPPALQPWRLRIAYVVDPAGLLWHIAQRRDGTIHD